MRLPRGHHCTAPVASDAASVEAIIAETAITTINRARRNTPRRPDQRCVDGVRKKEGYFDVGHRTLRLLEHGVLRFLTAGSVDDGKRR